METNPHIPPGVIEGIDAQIAHYKGMIEKLEFAKKSMIEQPPPKVHFMEVNPKLSKDFVRRFMSQIKKPVRTVEVIDMCFPNADEDTKSKHIKTLSVVFNTLKKDGQIKVEKQKGVKGNYYQWIKK